MTKTQYGVRSSVGIFSTVARRSCSGHDHRHAGRNRCSNSGGRNSTPVPGNNDLSVLGGDANQNQQAFRQRFNLSDPTQEQLAQWEEYDARLTANQQGRRLAISNRCVDQLDWNYYSKRRSARRRRHHGGSRLQPESLAVPSSTFPLWTCTRKPMTRVLRECGHNPMPARATTAQLGRVE